MSDPINPKHYRHLPAEAIDIIDAAIEGAPSPQAAAAQSHLLGYALRANQKGQLAIDAGKAEWYAARWLKAIREAEAKASGANETPIEPPRPSKTQPPSGYRLLGPAKDHTRFAFDLYWSISGGNWTPLLLHQVEYANRDNWTACRKITAPADDSSAPTKRYREPTLADLANGPIQCEVRDWDSEQWKARQLIQVHEFGPFRFLCKNESCDNPLNWNQCRIEVAE